MAQMVNVVSYCMEVRGTVVRFPVGTRDVCPIQSVQTDTGVHPDHYAVVTGACFSKGKAAGGSEALHSRPSCAQVKNEWSCYIGPEDTKIRFY